MRLGTHDGASTKPDLDQAGPAPEQSSDDFKINPSALQGRQLHIAPLSALLLSIGILVVGNGLQGTLLGVRAGLEGFPHQDVGILMSGYFGGYVLGAFLCPGLIKRAGHIRCFAAFAAISASTVLIHPIVISPAAWTMLRVISGICYAGIIIVAESWLNGHALRETRGRILAIYGMVLIGTWSASQLLLNLADPAGFVLFAVASVFVSLSLVPLALARSSFLGGVKATRFGLGRLYRISPLATVGCLMSGLCMSAFWGMGPTFAQQIGMDHSALSVFMAITMAGALVLQWPVGSMSDCFDRRKVLAAACLVTGISCLAIAYWAGGNLFRLLPLSFLFGGLGLTVYSLCVAHANDQIREDEMVPMASTLLLLYGVGAAFGPYFASLSMTVFGPKGLYLYAGTLQIALFGFAIHRLSRSAPIPPEKKEAFVAMPGGSHAASHVVLKLDPRGPTSGATTGGPDVGSRPSPDRRNDDPHDSSTEI